MNKFKPFFISNGFIWLIQMETHRIFQENFDFLDENFDFLLNFLDKNYDNCVDGDIKENPYFEGFPLSIQLHGMHNDIEDSHLDAWLTDICIDK